MHLDRFDGSVSEVWSNECIAEVGINSVYKLRCGCGQKPCSGFPDRNTESGLHQQNTSELNSAATELCRRI